jgi:hypothetical protein
LLAECVVLHVHDTIAAQLEDLIRAREPSRPPGGQELAGRVRALLGGMPAEAYGRWASAIKDYDEADLKLVIKEAAALEIAQPDPSKPAWHRRCGSNPLQKQ